MALPFIQGTLTIGLLVIFHATTLVDGYDLDSRIHRRPASTLTHLRYTEVLLLQDFSRN